MTRDEIIKMAREAGFLVDEKAQQHQPNCIFHTHHMVDELLERFAALVAAAEREACLDWCAAYAADDGTAQKIEAAIRAREEK
jgi:uncharacterized protein YfcZ (UPF0381/DUF406 family)